MKQIQITLPSLRVSSAKAADALFAPSAAPSILINRTAAFKRADSRSVLHFRAADLTRAIKAVSKAGQIVSGSEITRDGTIRILHGATEQADAHPFDRWKARRDASAS